MQNWHHVEVLYNIGSAAAHVSRLQTLLLGHDFSANPLLLFL